MLLHEMHNDNPCQCSAATAERPALDLGSVSPDLTCLHLPVEGAQLPADATTQCRAAAATLQATVIGDLVTLVGAITIIGYLEVGQNLRSFMPLMVYAVPVTGESLDRFYESSSQSGILTTGQQVAKQLHDWPGSHPIVWTTVVQASRD